MDLNGLARSMLNKLTLAQLNISKFIGTTTDYWIISFLTV